MMERQESRRGALQATGAVMLASLAAGGVAAATGEAKGGPTDVDIIRNRIAQYPFFYDSHELAKLAGLFWPDGSLRVNFEPADHVGRDAIHGWYTNMVKTTVNKEVAGLHTENRMFHVLTNHIIAIDGDKAEATADYFSLFVERNHATDKDPHPTASPRFSTNGRFRVSLAKRDGDWRFQRLEIDLNRAPSA